MDAKDAGNFLGATLTLLLLPMAAVLMPGVDAYFGTATYLPMADGARFEVSLTRTALIARPLNDAAREAVGEWGQ